MNRKKRKNIQHRIIIFSGIVIIRNVVVDKIRQFFNFTSYGGIYLVFTNIEARSSMLCMYFSEFRIQIQTKVTYTYSIYNNIYLYNQIILSDISNVPLFFHFVAFIQFNVIHTILHIPLNLKLCERSNNPIRIHSCTTIP